MAADLVRIRAHCLSGEYEVPHLAPWSLETGSNLP
jgi:hypothetical protein